jgi:hypothetical protein
MQLPPKLKAALDDSQPGAVERGEDSSADPELDRAPRRIQCRTAQRAKILVTKPLDTLPLLVIEDSSVRGFPLSQAQCLFGLKTYPQGDGRAKIELTPEVEHGEMKTQFIGRDGAVQPQMGQDRVVLDKLRLSAILAPGHVLMLSSTPEIKGVGSSFFAETDSGTIYRRILLVRLAVTQYDDLFAPDQMVTPLATPGE